MPTDVIHSTAHWVIREAPPIEGARLHFQLTPLLAVQDFLDLPPAIHQDLWTALGWIRDQYELTYWCMVWRCGDQAATGGTDDRAAAYIVVGDPDSQVRAKHVLSGPSGG